MTGRALLVAAQSGRALAEAARRAGFTPYVADIFGDVDTLALAAGHRRLPGRFGTGRAGGEALLARLDALAGLAERAGEPVAGLVLGSGFEGAPDLIARAAARHRLLGASAETVADLKDPRRFAALCAELAVPHPAVRFAPIADPRGWLLKRAGGSGGGHIRPAQVGPLPAGHYLQARVPGRALALNVLADGRDLHVLDLTEQWSAPAPDRPFRFAGALARAAAEPRALPPARRAEIAAAVGRVMARTGLRGLASADILATGSDWWLTEINPRPGATLDVLDRRAVPLLAAHVEAALGRLPALGPEPVDAAACEICYADRDLVTGPVLPSGVPWPAHVRDRPRAGTRVRAGAPLCTVLAAGPEGARAIETLRARVAGLRSALAQEETRG